MEIPQEEFDWIIINIIHIAISKYYNWENAKILWFLNLFELMEGIGKDWLSMNEEGIY